MNTHRVNERVNEIVGYYNASTYAALCGPCAKPHGDQAVPMDLEDAHEHVGTKCTGCGRELVTVEARALAEVHVLERDKAIEEADPGHDPDDPRNIRAEQRLTEARQRLETIRGRRAVERDEPGIEL